MNMDMDETEAAATHAAESPATESLPPTMGVAEQLAYSDYRWQDERAASYGWRTVFLRASGLLAVFIAGAAVIVGLWLTVGQQHSTSQQQLPTAASPVTALPTPVAAAATPPAPATVTVTKGETAPAGAPPEAQDGRQVFVICGDGSEGVVGGHTTCSFAENVRRAFYASGDSGDIVAFSPVTGERYEMSCSDGYLANFVDGTQRVATRCIGGDNDTAEVVLW